jgi:hypothetical protein
LTAAGAESARTARARKDTAPLVRATAAAVDLWALRGFENVAQLARLSFLRNTHHALFLQFADFLDHALGSLTDEELQQCALEFLRSKAVGEALAHPSLDEWWDDTRSQGIAQLWTLTQRAKPRLRSAIGWNAPLAAGHYELSPSVISQLPIDVQVIITRRSDKPAESFRSEIRAAPQHFEASLVAAAGDYGRRPVANGFGGEDERQASGLLDLAGSS